MKFNNLRRNILAILGEDWQKSESDGKISLHLVRSYRLTFVTFR